MRLNMIFFLLKIFKNIHERQQLSYTSFTTGIYHLINNIIINNIIIKVLSTICDLLPHLPCYLFSLFSFLIFSLIKLLRYHWYLRSCYLSTHNKTTHSKHSIVTKICTQYRIMFMKMSITVQDTSHIHTQPEDTMTTGNNYNYYYIS